MRTFTNWIIHCFIALLPSLAQANENVIAVSDYNMPYGVTPNSQNIYNLHMAGFYVCCGIGLIVFSVLIYSLIKFRRSKGAEAALFHENVAVEITWTIIPTIILIALAIPATIVLQGIHNTDESKLTIKVTGYQWRWKYDYLDQGISFFSNLSSTQDQINNVRPKSKYFLLEVDNPVVVPVNTKVKLLVTADDVIHAWWVPQLGVKQDGIPGFINENWFYATKLGTYRGQCGELCGVNHAFMPIVVQVVSQNDFNAWVKAHQTQATANIPSAIGPNDQNRAPVGNVTASLSKADATKADATRVDAAKVDATKAELMTLGKAQYEKNCAMCHQNNGEGLANAFPGLKGSKVVTSDADQNLKVVMHGTPGTAMQGYEDQFDDRTLAAILTYIRNAWGNDQLDTNKKSLIVQPQEIAAARKRIAS